MTVRQRSLVAVVMGHTGIMSVRVVIVMVMMMVMTFHSVTVTVCVNVIRLVVMRMMMVAGGRVAVSRCDTVVIMMVVSHRLMRVA